MALTARQVTEALHQIRMLANSLRQAAKSPPLEGEDVPPGTVLASAKGLSNVAEALLEQAKVLSELVPDMPVQLDDEGATRHLVRIEGLDDGGIILAVVPELNPKKVWELDASDDLLDYLSKRNPPTAKKPIRVHAYIVAGSIPPEVTDWDI